MNDFPQEVTIFITLEASFSGALSLSISSFCAGKGKIVLSHYVKTNLNVEISMNLKVSIDLEDTEY